MQLRRELTQELVTRKTAAHHAWLVFDYFGDAFTPVNGRRRVEAIAIRDLTSATLGRASSRQTEVNRQLSRLRGTDARAGAVRTASPSPTYANDHGAQTGGHAS
jgi:hypothetical protein